jgi:hypothetical protein
VQHTRTRYSVLLLVLALHLAAITLLIAFSKQRLRFSAPTSAIELLLLPPRSSAAAKVLTEPTVPESLPKIYPNPGPVNALTLVPQAGKSGESSGAAIDWAAEAQSVAAQIVANSVTADPAHGDEPRPPKSIFPGPPAHHAGDEITMPSGERAVFVSDDCYQVAASQPANASNTGMVNPTYCTGRSKTPRGDLFDQLPAYQRFHPN